MLQAAIFCAAPVPTPTILAARQMSDPLIEQLRSNERLGTTALLLLGDDAARVK